MMNITIINRKTDDGDAEEKEIYELAEEDNDTYRLLGRSIGISMEHCVILGLSHKDDFWHRVYGYRIIQNDKIERIILESTRDVNPEIESYMTVCFYERLADQRCMFIPKRLEITDHPELNNFPFNIAFGTITIADNNTQRFEASLYEPDFSTFTGDGFKQKMKYYNNLNQERRFWAEIIYDKDGQSYVGAKYRGDKSIGMAFGKSWHVFFAHFTALGVAESEVCE